jgi:CheY-like chemotaxis protein
MLSVIQGYAELSLARTAPDDPLHANLQEIFNAARRSSEITRQLLAFARRQTIAPRILDLNTTVEGMLKMLRRLIGEDIDLAWLPGSGLQPVRMDPSQLDQILANLCVNARDAIRDTGKITIETKNSRFNEAYCAQHAGFLPGEYVQLAVSDNGCGMDKETLSHLFEPFFTTKGVGKGTGLGLATIYGIVKQNDGFINVYSEPNQGSTFRIYLPAREGQSDETWQEQKTPLPKGRGETVLVVEDEEAILTLAGKILEMEGYRALGALDPNEAIALAGRHEGAIHLLVTDVVMPGMNGRELVERLRTIHPELKCLFMSGYTANAIAHHGVLDEGVRFLQKPFSNDDFAHKVREALDGP